MDIPSTIGPEEEKKHREKNVSTFVLDRAKKTKRVTGGKFEFRLDFFFVTAAPWIEEFGSRE